MTFSLSANVHLFLCFFCFALRSDTFINAKMNKSLADAVKRLHPVK